MLHYLYLLHFSRPLEHARHYLGCTHCVATRLARHADPATCDVAILRACHRDGVEWSLAGIWTAPGAWSAEILMKEREKNSPEYCALCGGNRCPPECVEFPLALYSGHISRLEISRKGY